MRRAFCLVLVTGIGVAATAATFQARQSRADLTVHQITDTLYMLANAPSVQGMGGGGNTAIFVTTDGVTLVDTKITGYGPDILAHVGALTDKPVTRIINTHTHWDHTGANHEFPAPVDIVVHENTQTHLMSDECDDGRGFDGGSIKNCNAFKGANARFLPTTTYADTLTLGRGADRIDLYHFGRGHTDGDTFVVFRAARTMHTGDMFQRRAVPFIDVEHGNGSATEFGDTLTQAVAGVSGVDTVIPGHNPTPVAWQDFADFSGFYNDIVTKAQQAKADGQTVDQFVDAYRPPSRYRDFAAPENGLRRNVQFIFDGR